MSPASSPYAMRVYERCANVHTARSRVVATLLSAWNTLEESRRLLSLATGTHVNWPNERSPRDRVVHTLRRYGAMRVAHPRRF